MDKNLINQFLSGAVMMGSLCCAFFFIKFWRKTSDRFFALFGAAFVIFALERWVFLFAPTQQEENNTYLYLIRLLSFGLIIFAVVDKNRA